MRHGLSVLLFLFASCSLDTAVLTPLRTDAAVDVVDPRDVGSTDTPGWEDVGSGWAFELSSCPNPGERKVSTNTVLAFSATPTLADAEVEVQCGEHTVLGQLRHEGDRWVWMGSEELPVNTSCEARLSGVSTVDGQVHADRRIKFQTGDGPSWTHRFEEPVELGTPEIPLRFPTEVFASDDTVVVVGPSPGQGIGVAVSRDAGRSFVYLSPERLPQGSEAEVDAAFHDGEIYLVWRNLAGSDGTIRFARSEGGLARLGPSFSLTEPGDRSADIDPHLDVGPNGVLVAWRGPCPLSSVCQGITLRRSSDGRSFDPPERFLDHTAFSATPFWLGQHVEILWTDLEATFRARVQSTGLGSVTRLGAPEGRVFLVGIDRIGPEAGRVRWYDWRQRENSFDFWSTPLSPGSLSSGRLLGQETSRRARRGFGTGVDEGQILLADCRELGGQTTRELSLSRDGGRSYQPAGVIDILRPSMGSDPEDGWCPPLAMEGSTTYLAWARLQDRYRPFFSRGRRLAPCEE